MSIQDIYNQIKVELILFLEGKFEKNTFEIVKTRLTRKVVKAIFMPLIYGKTVLSTANDIHKALSPFLTKSESNRIATQCFAFWKEKYPEMSILIELISDIGWYASTLDLPVRYSTEYFTTVQDYKCTKPVYIWIYDRLQKKRRRVTMRIPTTMRDRRKTMVATFANFIHQKDAYIAMKMILKTQAPVFTRHDIFITTPLYARSFPHLYNKVISELGSPLEFINKLILCNLLMRHLQSKIPDQKILQEYLDEYLKDLLPFSYKDALPDDFLSNILQRMKPTSLSKADN